MGEFNQPTTRFKSSKFKAATTTSRKPPKPTLSRKPELQSEFQPKPTSSTITAAATSTSAKQPFSTRAKSKWRTSSATATTRISSE